MATEKNPYDQIPTDNVIQIKAEEPMSANVSYQVDPETGEVEVDFQAEGAEIEVEIEIETEFYENLADKLDEETLQEIGRGVIDRYEVDKDSRAEWESMFERGFDLLGLKLEDTTEPFEGAATAVHPLIIETDVKFQSKASQE